MTKSRKIALTLKDDEVNATSSAGEEEIDHDEDEDEDEMDVDSGVASKMCVVSYSDVYCH